MHDELETGDLLARVTSDDILQFGMIPAAGGDSLASAGRGGLDPRLDRARERLDQAVSGLVLHGKRRVEFHRGRLEDDAHEKDVGARGLRSIIEEVMLDILYELPDQPPASKFLVTEDVVAGRRPVKKSASKPTGCGTLERSQGSEKQPWRNVRLRKRFQRRRESPIGPGVKEHETHPLGLALRGENQSPFAGPRGTVHGITIGARAQGGQGNEPAIVLDGESSERR